MPNDTNVELTTVGKGIGVVQLSCNYYTEKTPDNQRFSVSVEFKNNTCEEFIVINLCTSYIPDIESDESDMVFIRIELPSGYTYQGGTGVNENIEKIEKENNGNSVIFYLYSLNCNAECIQIEAYRSEIVTNLKPSLIEVQDYYDSSKLSQLINNLVQGNIIIFIPDKKAAIFYSTPTPLPLCPNHTNTLISQTNSMKMADDIINQGVVDLEKELFENSTEPSNERFGIALEFGLDSCENRLSMSVCVTRLSNDTSSDSDIEIILVILPSGFKYVNGTKENHEILVILSKILKTRIKLRYICSFQQLELLKDGNVVRYYVYAESDTQTCLSIQAERDEIPFKENNPQIEIFDVRYPSKNYLLSYLKF